MEKYIVPKMEIVEFEAEDVITTSCTSYSIAEGDICPFNS